MSDPVVPPVKGSVTERPPLGWTGLHRNVWNALLDQGITVGDADAVVVAISAALAAPVVPAERPHLPKRDVPALIEALRIRAMALTGETWERDATRDMMKEAADALEQAASAADRVSALRALIQRHTIDDRPMHGSRFDRFLTELWALLDPAERPAPDLKPK